MRVTVKTLDGKVITLEVNPTDTILQVKQRIRAHEGVEPREQQLLFAGRRLDDGHTLAMCGIQKGCVLHVCFRPQCGTTSAGARSTGDPFTAAAGSTDCTMNPFAAAATVAVEPPCMKPTPVDHVAQRAIGEPVHVLDEGQQQVWWCTLNHAVIRANSNKFYIIQLLQSDADDTYYMFTRWGRVGEVGQHSVCYQGPDLGEAKKRFEKKFRDKTGNVWSERASFERRPGKYALMEIEFASPPLCSSNDVKKPISVVVSSEGMEHAHVSSPECVEREHGATPAVVADPIRLLFHLIMMETLTSMQFDVRKMPLGKLTRGQLMHAKDTLQRIQHAMHSAADTGELIALSSEFYTLCPHSCGRQRLPIIGTEEMLQQKFHLIDTLLDFAAAVQVMQQDSEGDWDAPTLATLQRLMRKRSHDYHGNDSEADAMQLVLRLRGNQ